MINEMDVQEKDIIKKIASLNHKMRQHAFDMALGVGGKGAHLGGGLSIMEIMAALYGAVMKHDPANPYWAERDRFVLSKGHGVLAYYSALAETGYFSTDELKNFEIDGGPLGGHPVLDMSRGMEFSSGSLGMGLSFGLGIALTSRTHNVPFNVYVLLGDGECNEGSVWEAAMAASHYKLGNLIAIVDRNNLQYDGTNDKVMDLMDFKMKWQSFGWEAVEADGHNIPEIYHALSNKKRSSDKPYVIIAHTIKGNGVSFMEHQRDWHHNRLTQAQYDQAVMELKERYAKEEGDFSC
ncbi:transketolase [Saccharibacillus deserti]|uniref:transketolase n=1 Tax=Saccharibacillus deserti TaxID=1634444 RepID=UPI001FE8A2F8|nr:transketolase [Saccharibacillus deserti]